jgi:hypothetical protein
MKPAPARAIKRLKKTTFVLMEKISFRGLP